jgi:hypothetical protein
MRYAALKDLLINLYYLSEPERRLSCAMNMSPACGRHRPRSRATRAWAGAMPPDKLLTIA